MDNFNLAVFKGKKFYIWESLVKTLEQVEKCNFYMV